MCPVPKCNHSCVKFTNIITSVHFCLTVLQVSSEVYKPNEPHKEHACKIIGGNVNHMQTDCTMAPCTITQLAVGRVLGINIRQKGRKSTSRAAEHLHKHLDVWAGRQKINGVK